MRTRWIALALLAAGCDSPAEPVEETPQIEAVAVEPAEPQTPTIPGPQYAGRWATSADKCSSDWWRFWHDELLTADRMRCNILPPDGASGDTHRRAVCQKADKVTREDWTFDYPADKLMTLSRDGGEPITFGAC